MSILKESLEELVTANHILAREGVVDSFGHISVRHPANPNHYLLSCSRAPECIKVEDIMEFTLEGEPVDAKGRDPYAERAIHGSVYEARPDINAVVHNHSPNVIPFGVTDTCLRPLLHMAAGMGSNVPIWDSRTKFGDTTLLVTTMDMGRDLAVMLADNRAALMRGHGCVVVGKSAREVVFSSIYLEMNAELQFKAAMLGDITFLSDGEVEAILKRRGPYTFERAWERWCGRADRPYESAPGSTS
ncbi:MAG: ribulose-5-phosphate 4-epimerase/fuculose-1-phosphate aldolase [Gammaproteobacteria bacterium]|jgi:ribulose-5-phosphate 4-epimerase/fuculose-1-phosphate aldolase